MSVARQILRIKASRGYPDDSCGFAVYDVSLSAKLIARLELNNECIHEARARTRVF